MESIMDKPFTPEALERLIADVEAAIPSERQTFINTPSACKCELSLYPDRFIMDNRDLLWLGYKVGTIGSEQNQDKFWRMVNRYVSDGIIYRR